MHTNTLNKDDVQSDKDGWLATVEEKHKTLLIMGSGKQFQHEICLEIPKAL
jgi:hypothetical protein